MTTPRGYAVPATTFGTLLIGMLLAFTGTRLDGFIGGACQGAGLALIVLSAYMIGSRMRSAKKGEEQSMWLPSRDREEQ